jgi:hypothetical protein
MTPIRVPWAEPFVEIGGLGIHLRFSRPADNDVAKQRHPASGMEHVVRSLPANRRVNPVPRRRSHEDIEASTAVSHSSNVDVSTSTLGKEAIRWRASAAMSAPGSTAVTEHPSAASERVA